MRAPPDMPPIGRRALLAAALMPARAFAQAANPGGLRFEILRNGHPIGSHTIRLQDAGAERLAHIDVQMQVKFGFITLFRYRHQGTERWRDGQFVSLDTSTDNDGQKLSVSARRQDDGVRITTATGSVTMAPPDCLPLTHWNIACMHAPLFNPQDGTILHAEARPTGADTVRLADGTLVAARRFYVGGAMPIEDWYDETTTWTALRAVVKDGSVLEYKRVLF
jgi:hypothetical protein